MLSSEALRREGGAILIPWILAIVLLTPLASLAKNITLAWDTSADPTVSSYNIYYGTSSGSYTQIVGAGPFTSATLSNLNSGGTYYFVATSLNALGLESPYSQELSYTVPVANQAPTLDPIADLNISESAGAQIVNLTGISSGSSSQNQSLTVIAFSSSPSLIPNPVVSYSSPGATGYLTLAPTANSFGRATISVMVDNGGIVSNTIIRSFVVIVNPVNIPPTLDPINNLAVNQNSGPQVVALTGISSGSANETQLLTITAVSSKPDVVPNPTISYVSPNATGRLTLVPASNATGTATITVTVNDGQPTNNLLSRSFQLRVTQPVYAPNALTNVLIAPYSSFRFQLNPPFTNNDQLTYSLDASAPRGAQLITTAHSGTAFTWSPASDQASSTNIISIRLTDNSNPILSTNQTIVVTVLDYVAVTLGSTSAQAGQTALVPLYLNCSDGLTNLSFTIGWPSTRFLNPTLFVSVPGVAGGSVLNQVTNLLVSLQMAPGNYLQGSNLIAQLSFQTSASQPSGFVQLPTQILMALKPNGSSYFDHYAQIGQVAIANDLPLLSASTMPDNSRNLTVFARVGNRYQVQYSTNLTGAGGWNPLLTYTQTNLPQTLGLPSNLPLALYRVQQQ